MSATTRISQVQSSAAEIRIDDTSRIVLMSDIHRGTGSWADSFADNSNLYFAALNKYNKDKYTYIEIGDGDELWENKHLSEILSSYENIFELLYRFYTDGRLYMLFGNHDITKDNKLSPNKCHSDAEKHVASMFSQVYEGLILNYKDTGHKIFLVHGHQADLFNGPLWRINRFLVRYLWRPLEVIGVNDPTSASKSMKRKKKVENKLIQWSGKNKQMLIAGHTHRHAFPSPDKAPYFNDGSCIYRGYISAIEIIDGYIMLVKWSQKIREDGTLYIGRDVLDGPVRLEDYFSKLTRCTQD